MLGIAGAIAGLSEGMNRASRVSGSALGGEMPTTASAIRARQAAISQQALDELRYGIGIGVIGGIDIRETLKDLRPKVFKDELQDEIDIWLDDIP